ncbi:hypothetical protein FHK66_13870 (plasmid) [Enterococcus faecium]|uniref:exonuclease domain-containing protein n=1 Tax=Enterococcus faecium TaxID=1352 RepID=UPI0011165F60|nr:exonuclease domain-containing protein [Enterococcus faecium]QDA39554.1 hypothetical protein FHK66_13870 [Enterococcus faecium]
MGLFDFLKKKQGKVSKHVDYQLASSLFRTGKVFAEKLEVDISNVDEFRKTFIAFDVETTGLNSSSDRIVEIGAVLFKEGVPIQLLEKVQHESVLHKTIEALAHYYEVLPDWVSSEPEQEGFEGEIFEVFDDHNY